jgi:hypothetical protein
LRLRFKPAYNIEAVSSPIAPDDKPERVTGEAPFFMAFLSMEARVARTG